MMSEPHTWKHGISMDMADAHEASTQLHSIYMYPIAEKVWASIIIIIIIIIMLHYVALILSLALHYMSNAFPGVAAQCSLNLSAYPFVAYDECRGVQDPMDAWDGGFPNTLCCRNALTLFSQALASAHHSSLFVPPSEWDSCSSAFRLRYGLSPDSCGFHDLSLGSSKCSDLKLPDILGLQFYQTALDKCSHFDHPSQQSCADCVSAVLNIRDSLYDQMVGSSQDLPLETAVCGVAALVSLAAGKPDDPSLSDKFLRCWPPPPANRHNSEGFLKWFIISVLLAVIAMALTAIVVRLVWQKKADQKEEAGALKEITTWSGMYWFSKAEIENAIKQGKEKKWLGRGSAGEVFKGVLPSRQVVAIKHLNKTNSSDSFTREVEGLSRLRHPNLVCLFGCCIHNGERFLVYEYCAQGNLAQHLLSNIIHSFFFLNPLC